jgi:uncharacterized protein
MKTFLTCEWRKLAMANYAIDPSLLKKYLPNKTELDLLSGTCYVSLVGFMFLNTAVRGFKIPFHINFEEVNLRFYVKTRETDEHWKRGVVFIKEIVPKPALSYVANWLYDENYVTYPMKHRWSPQGHELEVEYQWKGSKWNSFQVRSVSESLPLKSQSEEEFILEHYWGYTKGAAAKTFEYQVEHPSWKVYPVMDHVIEVDFHELYGKEFAFLSHEKPASVFLAEGSEVAVKNKRVL